MSTLPRLETPRLILGPASPSHLAVAARLNCDPVVMRYIQPVLDPDMARIRIRRDIYRRYPPGLGHWAVRMRSRPRTTIGVALLQPLEARFGDVELGYFFDRLAWGRGYAGEAAKALLAYGLSVLRLAKIVAVTDPDNVASMRVLRKIGMRRVADGIAYGAPGPCFEAHIGTWRMRRARANGRSGTPRT